METSGDLSPGSGRHMSWMNFSADVLSGSTIWGSITGGDWVGTVVVGMAGCEGMGKKFCISLVKAGFHILDAMLFFRELLKENNYIRNRTPSFLLHHAD